MGTAWCARIGPAEARRFLLIAASVRRLLAAVQEIVNIPQQRIIEKPTTMRALRTLCLLLLCTTARLDAQSGNQKTWTYTYLKAVDGQKEGLKEYLKKNWFVMDSIAVRQGLFNDYELIENVSKDDSSSWDFIVAVEYFTAGTFSDIAGKWQEISRAHQVVNVDGRGFGELGRIIRSEDVQKRTEIKSVANCAGKQFDILTPFLGDWDEYLVEDGEERLFGRLSITLHPEGCTFGKRFFLYNRAGSYLTSGYFDLAENAWIETFSFRNGSYSKYKWLAEGHDVVMERISSSLASDYLNRNRWTKTTADGFEILEERSYDSGKTWARYSTTTLRRK
ncbi:MAG: hypothetical protein ACOVSV_04380 [Fimbriimonadaceae bacterium]|jgi:hypothetical protein